MKSHYKPTFGKISVPSSIRMLINASFSKKAEKEFCAEALLKKKFLRGGGGGGAHCD